MAHAIKVKIPDSLDFSDLKLARDNDGHISFDWQPIDSICTASGINPAVFRDMPEDNVSGLIIQWYGHHIADGGDRDPIADELLAEVMLEDAPALGGTQ